MMNQRLSSIFLAIALIGFGTILVLGNLGIGEISTNDMWSYFFPVFFIVIGLTLLIGYFAKQSNGWMFGSFILILGILLLLGQLPTVDFEFTFSHVFKLWPLLIIYIGFSMIGLGNRRKRARVHMYKKGKKFYKGWQNITIGNEDYREPNWEVKPINISNAIGDHYFDFTKAFIPDEEIPITINSWAGDIRMVLPENIDYKIEVYVKAGDINVLGQTAEGINRQIHYRTTDYDTATKKLDIFIDLKAGSVRIDQI